MIAISRRAFFLSLLICLMLLVGLACEKSTGDDDGDNDDDDAQGVGAYQIYLNMVPVIIGEAATPEKISVFDQEGNKHDAEGVLLTDFLAGITEFAPDAGKFVYQFINNAEETVLAKKQLESYEDYADAVLYQHPENETLCLGWSDQAREDAAICDMDNGWIVTHPIDGAFDLKPISYLTERSGNDPAHINEEVASVGVVTMGTGVMVSGSYMKTYFQADGHGVKLFADMSATPDSLGYDGSLFKEINTFEGDEIFVKGKVTVHEQTIEFVPVSGYHLAVLAKNEPVEEPVLKTIAELDAARYDYAGSLIRIDDVEMVDVNPDDATTDWPEYGTKSKGIRIRTAGAGGLKIGMPVYEGTGIPGSFKPASPFDAVGVLDIAGSSLELFPRKIEDVNPLKEPLKGNIRVTVSGEDKVRVVKLADLQACAQPVEAGGDPVAVVSLASIAGAAGIMRNPKLLGFKPVAYDGRQPFKTMIFDDLKSGVLYQQTPSSDEEPDPMLGSYFWEGMGLSQIFYLDGVTEVQAFRQLEGPEEGDAVHGKGVTLIINEQHFAINFDTLARTEYEGAEAIAMKLFISEQVIDQFTMNGSFTTDQIRLLYDYRLVSYDESEQTIIRLADLANGYLVMSDPPYAVFPDFGDSARIDDLYTIDMMRYIQVDLGAGDPEIKYLRDLDTQSVDVGEGQMEEVVFYSSVLEEAGFDTGQNTYLFNFWLKAADDFTSIFPFRHNHLTDMYFRPLANRGYTVDQGLGNYGGRVSTKAVYEIELHDVPQAAPSIPVVIDDQTLWGFDAQTCEGCHYSHEQINIPIDCYSCHTAP